MNSPKNLTTNAELHGKICLITGASRTLGAEIASAMARRGVHIAVNYHKAEEAAQKLCAELHAFGVAAQAIQADVSNPEAVEQLINRTEKALGPIDILINNVGPYVDTPFLDMTLDDFDRILATNVRATFMMSQMVGGGMKARGHGHIINIAATDIFNRSHSIYGLAKQAVVYLTEAMALELAPDVRLNALAPDLIADNEDMSAEFAGQAVAATPLGRLVTRAEVAEMICLMCTTAFDSVTGQTIVMDGGRSIPRIAIGG